MCSILVMSGGAQLVGQCCVQDTVPVAMEMPMDCHAPTDTSHSETLECMCDQCHALISATWVNPVEPHYAVVDCISDSSGRYLQMHSAAFHPPRQNA